MIWSNSGGCCTVRQENTPPLRTVCSILYFHYWALWFDQILVDAAQWGKKTHTLWGQSTGTLKIISLLLNVMTWSVWWTLPAEVRKHPSGPSAKTKSLNVPLVQWGSRLTSLTIFVFSMMASLGTFVAPICWVMPPASPSWTLVRRNWNRQEAQCQRTLNTRLPTWYNVTENQLNTRSPTW